MEYLHEIRGTDKHRSLHIKFCFIRDVNYFSTGDINWIDCLKFKTRFKKQKNLILYVRAHDAPDLVQ